MPSKSEPDNLLLDHRYDDIQEFDNPMPRWWVYIFWATIVFSVLYWLNVPGIGVGKGSIASYRAEIAAAEAAAARRNANRPAASTPEQLTALTRDRAAVALGKEVFKRNCAACHRLDGGGQIGPNLTDDYWLHGAAIGQVLATVSNGVLEKGMPPWGKVLKPAQLDAVTAYVVTLRGTNPPNPRPPQGELVAQ